MNNQSSDLVILSKRRGKVRKTRFAINDSVGFVHKVADSVALCVLNVHTRSAEITPSEIREFTSDVSLCRPASAVAENLVNGIFGDGAAIVVGYKVAGGGVDVEAVRDVFTVEGEGGAIDDNGCVLLAW